MDRATMRRVSLAVAAAMVLILALAAPAASVGPYGPITYQAHVQGIGWQPYAAEGEVAGTTGRALRMEAIRIKGVDTYRAHVEGIGWMGWVESPNTAGTTGRSLRMEAIQTTVVQCRAHVQGIGWMPWVNPGETCGTTGRSLRLEAVQLRGPAPTPVPPANSDVIVAAGDFGLEATGLDTMSRMGAEPADLALILGDLGYGTTAQPFCQEWNGRVRHELMWVQGNHETRDSDGARTADYAACLPGRGSGTEGVEQVLDVGDWTRIITASPQNGISYVPGSAGHNRIAAAIDGAQGRWVILAMHEPYYSVGSHGPSGEDSRQLAYLAREKGVRLVLQAHDHNYSRIVTDGTTHIVAGMAGHKLRDLNYSAKHWPLVQVAYPGMTGPGFVRLTVTQDRIVGTLVGSGGDSFTITR